MTNYSAFRNGLLASILCLLTSYSSVLVAEQSLSVDEIKALFTDMTVEGEVVEVTGLRFKGYYGADGAFRGKKSNGQWKVTEEGKHCVRYGDKDWSCGVLISLGDGRYKKLKDIAGSQVITTHSVTFDTFTQGNPDGL